jgi:phospholipase/carboxylesterase
MKNTAKKSAVNYLNWFNMYSHSKKVIRSGVPLEEAKKVLIMLHGRGSTAENIISLKDHLLVDGAAILAPQATNNSWYPYSFMAPVSENQPALDSALNLLNELVGEIEAQGKSSQQIYFLGFSQGACLALEYATRHAKAYGGVIAFTGGLIGETLTRENYTGDFQDSPILITTGDPDPHVPLIRVQDSVKILQKLNAKVELKVYEGRVHTIQMEEIELANDLVLKA